jgi:hypothetical protein
LMDETWAKERKHYMDSVNIHEMGMFYFLWLCQALCLNKSLPIDILNIYKVDMIYWTTQYFNLYHRSMSDFLYLAYCSFMKLLLISSDSTFIPFISTLFSLLVKKTVTKIKL